MKFKNYIQKHRKLKNLSVSEAAEKLGVTPRTIHNWESGGVMPKRSVRPRVSALLGISLPQLERKIAMEKSPRSTKRQRRRRSPRISSNGVAPNQVSVGDLRTLIKIADSFGGEIPYDAVCSLLKKIASVR